MLETVVGGFDKAFNTAAVKTTTFKAITKHTTIGGLSHQRVSNLQLTVAARRGLAQDVKNIRSQNITTNNSQIGRRFFRVRFFHHLSDTEYTWRLFQTINNTVTGSLVFWHLLNSYNAALVFFVELDHLGQNGVLARIRNTVVVCKQHSKRL